MKLLLNIFATFAIFTSAFANESQTKLASFSYPDIRTNGVNILTGPEVYFNSAFPWCWIMGHNYSSYITVSVDFSKADLEKPWYLNIKQLSSIADYNYSPIAIDVNHVNIVDHFEPQRDGWRIDHFQLSNLKEGKNNITIRLQDAYTNYWIEHLTISPNEPVKIWIVDPNDWNKR